MEFEVIILVLEIAKNVTVIISSIVTILNKIKNNRPSPK